MFYHRNTQGRSDFSLDHYRIHEEDVLQRHLEKRASPLKVITNSDFCALVSPYSVPITLSSARLRKQGKREKAGQSGVIRQREGDELLFLSKAIR